MKKEEKEGMKSDWIRIHNVSLLYVLKQKNPESATHPSIFQSGAFRF